MTAALMAGVGVIALLSAQNGSWGLKVELYFGKVDLPVVDCRLRQ